MFLSNKIDIDHLPSSPLIVLPYDAVALHSAAAVFFSIRPVFVYLTSSLFCFARFLLLQSGERRTSPESAVTLGWCQLCKYDVRKSSTMKLIFALVHQVQCCWIDSGVWDFLFFFYWIQIDQLFSRWRDSMLMAAGRESSLQGKICYPSHKTTFVCLPGPSNH